MPVGQEHDGPVPGRSFGPGAPGSPAGSRPGAMIGSHGLPTPTRPTPWRSCSQAFRRAAVAWVEGLPLSIELPEGIVVHGFWEPGGRTPFWLISSPIPPRNGFARTGAVLSGVRGRLCRMAGCFSTHFGRLCPNFPRLPHLGWFYSGGLMFTLRVLPTGEGKTWWGVQELNLQPPD